MIVDPWGVVLAVAPDEDTVISAELDRVRLLRIRESLPSLANRQPHAYRWPDLAPSAGEGSRRAEPRSAPA
jgi:predicted amidohydrolase